MNRDIRNFFTELKRRHIYRVAAGYTLVAWVLLQIVNNLAPGLNLPNSVLTVVVFLLALGFPIALVFAWIVELKAPQTNTPSDTTIGSVDWWLFGALIIVIVMLSYQEIAPFRTISTVEAGVEAASQPSAPKVISIAVLPFTNLSGDPNQEFFSDGMTEEITAALTKVAMLRVVGRTSAFQFKGENKDLRAIGTALSATHLIEGSVRKDGNQVRITAQLIKAVDGTHVWTESYNRELKGVFVVQEEIAEAIAASLSVPLGLKEGESLVPSRATDLDSYQDFLRAKALVRSRSAREPGGPLTKAAGLLEGVVARDPGYVPAWALLAQVYGFVASYGSLFFTGSDQELKNIIDAWLPKAEAAAQQALRLDKNSAEAYVSLGAIQNFRGQMLAAETSYERALALQPDNPDVLHLYSMLLGSVGHVNEAVALRQRLQVLEPFVLVFNAVTANYLWLAGQDTLATAMLRDMPREHPFIARQFALMFAAEGHHSEAADALLKASGTFDSEVIAAASSLMGAPAAAVLPEKLPRLWFFSVLYGFTAAPDRALESVEANLDAGFWAATDVPQFWHPSFAAVRKTERFKTFVRKTHLVEFWRARGWPDQCRPLGANDLTCG